MRGRMSPFSHSRAQGNRSASNSPDAVVSNFLQGRPSSSSFNPTSNISDYAPMLHKYNSEYQLVKQKMKKSSDDGSDHENNGGFWCDRSMDGLEINELDQYWKSLEGLRDSVVVTKVKQMESNLVAVHNEPQMTSSMGDEVTRDHDAEKDIIVHHDMMKDDCIKGSGNDECQSSFVSTHDRYHLGGTTDDVRIATNAFDVRSPFVVSGTDGLLYWD
ncbi:hypothetical protein Droror1_Dr00027113 [Drosera rotundifolia]